MDCLKIKKVRRGFIVINSKTGNHTHMRSKYGCYCICKFIREGIIPDNTYLKESYKRLTMSKKEYKQQYYNVGGRGIDIL